jgi:hypothetical protein
MAAFIAIVFGAACAFYGYALVQFRREIDLLRSQRNRGATMIVPFRSAPESRQRAESDRQTKVTVLPLSGMANRDVA